MRIRSLNLTRYGHFTDHVLEFGPPASPDFHVVFGANEAGKSTLLNAWLDFLYGIEGQTPYNFLHAYNTMRIGAVVEDGAQTLALSRIKGNKNTLLDAHDAIVADDRLSVFLHGLDRKALSIMFSLGKKTLEIGGESILASEGELGRLLFSAGSGLSSLSGAVSGLKARAEEFYIPNSRKRSLQLEVLKQQLKGLHDEIRRTDIDAASYRKLKDELERAADAYKEADRRFTLESEALATLKGRLQALGPWQRRRGLVADIEAIVPGDLPDEAVTWLKLIPSLIDQLGERRGKRDALLGRVERLRTELAGIVVNEAELTFGDRLTEMEAAYNKDGSAEKDIPLRRREVEETERKIGEILYALGVGDGTELTALMLTDAKKTELRRLSRRLMEQEQRLETSREELRKAGEQARLAEARVKAGTLPAAEALAAFNRLLQRMGSSGLRTDLAAALKELQRVERSLREMGDGEIIGFDPPEPALLKSWQDALERAETTVRRE
ncbi:MAG: AAA family ATPase, partial [Methylobacteriaceae bacterium]|nr:AAA family ATPase [Methylobacteriaceae bacterium]